MQILKLHMDDESSSSWKGNVNYLLSLTGHSVEEISDL